MEDFINIDKTFEKVIMMDAKISNSEFDGCVFKNCDFSNTAFLNCMFLDCEFYDCNLSMAKLPGSGLKTVQFINSKLLGIRFDECDDFLFAMHCRDSVLDYSWFTRKKMPKTHFANCSLKGVNFVGCDLTSTIFENANLEGAVFDETILAGADFTTAYHFRIDPERNPMKKAKFSTAGIPGLLERYDIKIE